MAYLHRKIPKKNPAVRAAMTKVPVSPIYVRLRTKNVERAIEMPAVSCTFISLYSESPLIINDAIQTKVNPEMTHARKGDKNHENTVRPKFLQFIC